MWAMSIHFKYGKALGATLLQRATAQCYRFPGWKCQSGNESIRASASEMGWLRFRKERHHLALSVQGTRRSTNAGPLNFMSQVSSHEFGCLGRAVDYLQRRHHQTHIYAIWLCK
jgi:hypothetical protein